MAYAAARDLFEIQLFLRDTLAMSCIDSTVTCALSSKNPKVLQWTIASCSERFNVDNMITRHTITNYGVELLRHILH